VDVIVTDHHDLPASLPDAYAIINPKLLSPLPGGETHPLGTLPGVGVAYKLAEALYVRAGNPEGVDQYLDLVALGIVADLALLRGEARYLLQRGLEALRHPRRTGLQTMMALAELYPEHLTEEHIGYVLAPRLNALGRLSDANAAVELLTTQDSGRARVLASQLEGLNAQRQLLTNQVFQAAQAQIERTPSLLDHAALVLAHPRWPAGVIGIVASQLVEQYNKPVVLISTPDGGPARGSARSIEGVNIAAAIASQAELLDRFGGHPMAAGLALHAERVDEFRSGLSKAVEEMLGQIETEPHLNIDAFLDLSGISLKLVEDLERLAPFGPGNPALTLACNDLVLKNHTEVGRNREHRRMFVEDERGKIQEIIWWNGSNWRLPEGKFDLAFHLRASDYRGQREVQVEWIASRPAGGTSALPAEAIPITVLDYRGKPQPLQVLKSLPEADLLVWCEGEAKNKLAAFGLNVQDRDTLSPGQTLAIWTTPPGQRELRAVLQTVSPQKVYLFGLDPVETELETFLKRLAGLVKYSLTHQNGQVRISHLAAGTAQRETAIRKGLAWMAAKGYLRVSEEGDRWVVSKPGEADPHDLKQITSQLQAMFKETAAYRAHFARSSAEHLINPPEGD
jgi:single-stranded-DNA-specific exonuclease